MKCTDVARRMGAIARACVIAAAIVAIAPTAEAAPVTCGPACIEFGTILTGDPLSDPLPGLITFSGAVGDSMIGQNIPINFIRGWSTPDHDGAALLTIAVLNFISGPFVGFDGDQWVFDGGGAFSISGVVPGLVPDPDEEDALLPELVGGGFLGARFGNIAVDVGGNTIPFGLVSSLGLDFKHPLIAAYFGYSPLTPFVNAGSVLSTATTTAPNFAVAGFGASLTNTPITAEAIPEPTSLLLLGTGLTVAWRCRRRRT